MADDLNQPYIGYRSAGRRPESGLPANLRLKYQDLEKVTVPQAVERVAKINEWRAAQKAEADMARAMGPATQVVKEYPDQGFKWVELKQPEVKELPSGYSVKPMDKDGWYAVYEPPSEAYPQGRSTGAVGKSPEEAIANQDFGRMSLEDALKYEGETMGHCVGGYCPDVVEGRSKIYSLRDKKGQPHVTIKVAPRPLKTWDDVTAAVGPDEAGKLYKEFDDIGGYNMDNTDAAFDMFIQNKGIKPAEDIVQIKGKANRAPNAEYLPAVQDFVRSGNWGRVGDLGNAGMTPVEKAFSPADLEKIRALGDTPKFVTPEETEGLMQKLISEGATKPESQNWLQDMYGTPPEGYADGGIVTAQLTDERRQELERLKELMRKPAEKFERKKRADDNLNPTKKSDTQSLEALYAAYDGGDVERFAEGGVVTGANFPTGDFDAARIDSIVDDLHALNAG